MGSGACLLLKTESFLKLMRGRFIPNNFHAGLIYQVYRARNMKTSVDYPAEAGGIQLPLNT